MRVKQPFETVVSEHARTVWRVCRALVGPVDADDAWSETFLSGLKAYPDLAGDANVEAWLITIAHHMAIDIIRARTHRALPIDHIPEPPTTPQQNNDDLLETLDRLPDKQRQAFAYHYLAGLPYAEVAETIGDATAAVRRAAADGIAALRLATRSAPARLGPTGKGETHEPQHQ